MSTSLIPAQWDALYLLARTNEVAADFGDAARAALVDLERLEKREIVCLIGSSRFERLHLEAMRRETLAGKIVLPLGLYGHVEGIDMDGPVKKMLDELHLHKIDLADTVLVINGNALTCHYCGKVFLYTATTWLNCTPCCNAGAYDKPYIGSSTRNELAYARQYGKKIRWLNLPDQNALEGEGQ